MNDEQDRDKGHIKKYYGPPKTNTVEQYAATNLNNNAFANEDSVVKPGANATGKGPSKTQIIKPLTPTGGGKEKGKGKNIKIVDTPKKENPRIPTFNESAETSNDERKVETPTVTTPAKEPPSSPPSAEPLKTETQTLARESENKDMLKEPSENGKGDTDSDTDPKQDVTGSRQQKEWKPSVTSQRMMDAGLAGLNMFGNVLGGANKAFSMLRGLTSALTSRQLMSDPTLPAKGFLQAMDRSGDIVEEGIRNAGEFYGIKDGVRSEDLVGTYKGAQYYREKKAIEDMEKDYYGKVGSALSQVLGNNVDVNDPVSIQNAIAQMDGTQLSQLDNALFGQNGSLAAMYSSTMDPATAPRQQKAQAKLLSELNKALKGQATSNARQAGLERSEANAQARQKREESRRYRDQDMAIFRQAQAQVADPASMAGMSGREQMGAIIRSAIGRRMMNGDIPMQRSADGQWGMLNTDQLDINALNSIRRELEGGQVMNHPATQQAARQLYNEVQTKLNAARQEGVRFRQQQKESALAELMDSPLEYDMEDRGGRRDGYGIPESMASRRTLYNNAWYTMQDLMSRNGDANDIALCENVMQMCDMADFREGLMKRVRDMEQDGSITPMEAELIRQNANRAYEEMVSALPMTREGRDRYIQEGKEWKRNQRTDVMYNNMQALGDNLDNITRYHSQAERERRKEMEQAARDERMRPYMNSPVDLDMNSGSKADRDDRGIPTDKGKRNKLYVKAQNMLRDLRQNNGDQKDIDLCRNVMALCDLADRRDELTNTVRDMRKAGVISALEEEMYLDEANRYYDLASAELATTVDERKARIAAKENWTENMRTGEMSSNMDELHQMIEDERTGFANQERDRRRAQEQARREAQRSAELQPYQNSPLDLDLRTGKKTNRDRYNIPRTYAGQKALRNNADDMIRTLIDEGGDEKDIALCENVRTLAEAAMQRSEIESYLSRLEAKGKISKEEAELARQNAYRAYNDLAGRLPVTVGDRDARIQAGQDWEQDDATDNLSIDLESTMNHLKYLEGEHDTRVREDREALREQRRRERAENRARAKEQARQEQDAKAKAEWEEQADRDDRGISLAPWNKDNNKYRKKDIADAQVRLAEIEKELESIPIRSDTVSERTKLREEKRDLLTKIRRTCQEDHIQKLIAEAGRFDVTTREELVQKAIELRDTTSNWDEFGKAINDLRDEYKLGPDRAWQSTKRREEGLRRKARDEVRIKGMEDIASAIRGTPQQMVDLLSKAFADPKGDLNKGVMNMLKASNIDLKTMLLGSDDNSVRSAVREAIRQSFKMNAKEGLRDLIKDGMKDYMSGIGDSLNGITDAVNDLNDVDKSNIVKGVNNVEKAVTGMADMVAKVFAGDDPDQPMTMKDFRDGVTGLQAQVYNLLKEVNGKIPLGGIGSPQATLDPATLKALQTQATNLNTLNDNLSALIPTLNGRETLTKEDLKELIKAINAEDMGKIPLNDLEDNDLFGGNGIWRSEDDYNRFMDMVDQIRTTMSYVNEDMDRQRAEGVERPGIPVDPIDRLANGVVDEAIQELRQNSTEDPARVSPPEPDGPEEGAVVPEEVQEAEEVSQETSGTNGYGSDDYSYGGIKDPMQFAVDNFLEDNPGLAGYLREHPEEKTMLYERDENGEPIHQTIKGIVDNSTFWDAFGEDTPEIMMELAEDLLSQTDLRGIKDVETKWMQAMEDDPNLSQFDREIRAGAIANMKGRITSILEGVLRASAEERRKVDPTVEPVDDAAQRKKAERNIRHFFSTMLSEAEFERKGGAKVPPEKRQAMLNDRRDQAIRTVLGEPASEAEKKIADFVGENLYYNLSKPSWRDYDDVLTSLKSMENVPEAQRAHHRIMTREVLPRLFTMKNNGGAKERGEELQELTNLAIQFGRASEADRKYFDYDAIVNTMLKGPAALRYTNSAMNNAFKRAYTKAKGYKSLDDAINNEIKLAKESTDITDFNTKVSGFMEDHGTKLKDLEGWVKDNLSKTSTVGKIDAQLKKIITAQNAANKIKKELADAKNMVKEEVSNEYGSKKIPDNIRDEIRRIKSEQANDVDPQKVLDQFVGEGKYAKLASTLRDMRLEAQARSIAGDKNLKALGMTQEIADRLVETASHSDDPDSALVQLKAKWIEENTPKTGTPKVETPTETTESTESTVTPESVEEARSNLQATVDPDKTIKTPEEAKERIVDYLNNNGGGRAGLNDLAEKLGLKKEGDGVWKFNRPNMRLIADAVVKGWEFLEAPPESEDDEEEEDIMGYGGGW